MAKFLNGLVGGFGVKTDKNDGGLSTVSLDRQALQHEIENVTNALKVSKDAGKPEDKTDTPDVLDTSGDSWTWTANGKNGLELDAYYKIGTAGTYHLFQRCRLTISKDGLIVLANGLPDRIRVRA